jgi:hypothetical protein
MQRHNIIKLTHTLTCQAIKGIMFVYAKNAIHSLHTNTFPILYIKNGNFSFVLIAL